MSSAELSNYTPSISMSFTAIIAVIVLVAFHLIRNKQDAMNHLSGADDLLRQTKHGLRRVAVMLKDEGPGAVHRLKLPLLEFIISQGRYVILTRPRK